MCHIIVVAALLVGIPSLLPAQEPSPAKSIEQLIEQLSSQDFKVREAAAKEIETLGPQALPALRKAKDHPDLDVRRRIREWIPKFELQGFVAPKRVTLNVKDQPLDKVVAELARQTGYPLELAAKDARVKKSITLQCTKATFWEALDKIGQQTGLELSRGPNTEKLPLSFEGVSSPHRSYHGAFRLRANGFHYMQQTTVVKDIEYSAPMARKILALGPLNDNKQVSESFRFDFDLVAEPRLTVLYLGEPILSEARDDQKRSLLPKKEAEDERFAMHNRFMSSHHMRHRFFMGQHGESATVNLLVPAKGARTMKVLRGTIPVSLEKETKRTVLVDNLAKSAGKKHKSDECTVEVDLFKDLGASQYSIYFSVTKHKGEDQNEFMLDSDSFVLEDAKGQRYEAHGSSMSGGGKATEAHIRFGPAMNNAAPPGPPVRLVYLKSIPLEVSIPFEFKDLPLP